MKKFFLTMTFVALASVVQAQTPATVHVFWLPNPTADNVVQYLVTPDAGTPIVVLASACSTTQCPSAPQIVTFPAFGLHTITVVAQNLKLSTDPTSLQSGPPLSLSFTLGVMPTIVAGGKVTN